MRSALDDFHRCARKLGIFGFDLSEEHATAGHHQQFTTAGDCIPDATSRLKLDFAVLDEETKPTVHAILESVHPDSIAILKFDPYARPDTAQPLAATHP